MPESVDPDQQIQSIHDIAADAGHMSPTVQGLLVYVAKKVAADDVGDYCRRVAAALVAGLDEYDAKVVAA